MRPSWQVVCHVSDIANAGDWQTLEFLGESILVIRGDDMNVRAFTNVCRHRGSRLVERRVGLREAADLPVSRLDLWPRWPTGRRSGQE